MAGNASVSQYGPTPTPSCVTCTPPAPPLPYTGANLGPEAVVGGLLLTFGVAVAVILRRWPR